jgi:hypothetical protein
MLKFTPRQAASGYYDWFINNDVNNIAVFVEDMWSPRSKLQLVAMEAKESGGVYADHMNWSDVIFLSYISTILSLLDCQ